jgi:hypothetical protein
VNEAQGITGVTWNVSAQDPDLREQMIYYLQYDDGYEECLDVESSDPLVVEFKRIKPEHLIRAANDPRRWLMSVPKNWHKEDFKFSSVRLTCRLIALRHNDSNAIRVLREASPHSIVTTAVEATGLDLEVRSLDCMMRMIKLVEQHLNSTMVEDREALRGVERGSKEWALLFLRLSALQVRN